MQGTASATRTLTITSGLADIGDFQLVEDPNPTPPGNPSTLFGTISLADAGNGTNLSGITVFLVRPDGTQIEQTTTAANGSYSFYVPAGSYTLRAARVGYRTGETGANITNPSNPLRVDLALQPE